MLDVQLSDGGTATIEARHYLVATGAAPWIPPISGLAGAGYLTSATAMELTELPESMLVIGGNAVGLELAQLFARLGTRVTIAEALDRLAPFDEPEISAAIEDVFDDEGIGILTAAAITSVRGDATARSPAPNPHAPTWPPAAASTPKSGTRTPPSKAAAATSAPCSPIRHDRTNTTEEQPCTRGN